MRRNSVVWNELRACSVPELAEPLSRTTAEWNRAIAQAIAAAAEGAAMSSSYRIRMSAARTYAGIVRIFTLVEGVTNIDERDACDLSIWSTFATRLPHGNDGKR